MLLSRFLEWFGDAKAPKSARAFQLGCPWAHTASSIANKPPEGVWGTFDAVAGTEAVAYRAFPALNDLVLWSNAPSKEPGLARCSPPPKIMRSLESWSAADHSWDPKFICPQGTIAEISSQSFKGKECLSPFPYTTSMLMWANPNRQLCYNIFLQVSTNCLEQNRTGSFNTDFERNTNFKILQA